MLENERIIVQDRGGIDAGIAALMQNANKGFDPAALMAMRMGWKRLRSWKPSRNKL